MSWEKPGSAKIYTVAELTGKIKFILEDEFPFIRAEGEISNVVRHSSGHLYFSLKDADAQISCVMWQSRNSRLLFRPEDGMKVIVSGRITVYGRQGRYQLDAESLQLSGRGELQAAFEDLKRSLAAEGLFDAGHKKQVPFFPRSVGIVTSPTGAAIRDIVSVIRRRCPAVQLIISPVRVQGDQAAGEICDAIHDFNEYGDVDVLIVGRGGGSIEDLQPFNEECVARAVHGSRIPVISAVGHEIDFCICDFAADLRAPTPSAAAELAVPDRLELADALQQYRARISRTVHQLLSRKREQVKNAARSYGMRMPESRIRELRIRLDDSDSSLKHSAERYCERLKAALENQAAALRVLSPGQVLQRGYSITVNCSNGNVVTDSGALAEEDMIMTRFARGSVRSQVRSIDG